MSEPLDWPTIKARYPELHERLKAGDMDARVEFVRLSFGGEIVEVIHKPTSNSQNGQNRR